MKIALLAAALLAVAPAAFATHTAPPPTPSSHSSSSSSALAGAAAVADTDIGPITVTATPTANAAGGAGGSAAATASGGNGNSSVTVSAPRNAPSIAQGSLVPSGCGAGANGGGSNTHGAGFLGFAWTTDECYLFMLGEKFAAIGMPDTACDIWLQTKAAKRVFRGKRRPPSCDIERPTAKATEISLKLNSPPIQVELPTVPVQEPPAAAACTPATPTQKAPARASRKSSTRPMPPVVTCIK